MLFNLVHYSPVLVKGFEYQVRWSNSDLEQAVEVLIFPPGGQSPQTAIRLASRPFRDHGIVTGHPPEHIVLNFPCADPPVRNVAIDAMRAVIRLDDGSLITLERVNQPEGYTPVTAARKS